MMEDQWGPAVTAGLLFLWLGAMWWRQRRDGPGGPPAGRPW